MKNRLAAKLPIIALLALTVPGVALATPNLFVPTAGDGFHFGQGPSPQYVYSNGGIIESIDGTNYESVEASLGHAQGGSNGFYIQGFGNGNTIYMNIYAFSGTSNVGYGLGGNTSASTWYSVAFPTSFPSADMFYYAQVSLPPTRSGAAATVTGVKVTN